MSETNGHSGNGKPSENGHTKPTLPDGGLGGQTVLHDMRLRERAMRERWNVTPDMRRLGLETAMDIMQNGESDRARLAAVRTIQHADKINIEQEQGPEKHNHLHVEGIDWQSMFNRTRPQSSRDVIDVDDPKVEERQNGSSDS